MNVADCYRVLGLRAGASFADIKASYRRLARRYHPDVNPDDQRAKDKFIQITEAYKVLTSIVPPTEADRKASDQADDSKVGEQQDAAVSKPVSTKVKVTRKQPAVEFNPNLSDVERQLKQTSYEQLQELLKAKRFPRAIALVDGLAQRITQDPEIRQWQAIIYQRWGRDLISKNQFDKARNYLKKALRTDPHNKSLWAEVEKDFKQMERKF
ncbi:MAG: DnaJ domain-containing protein [Cyanothece sp. SIO1E1]|nr:DnaJ domain-containing protein [Cyanothece sp. SIO1E1]